ncbi:MAG: hypothetical protein ACP5QO_12260 [Clostridia bacterium]
MARLSQVEAAGEHLVTEDLRRKGYRMRPSMREWRMVILAAEAGTNRLLVAVTATAAPEEPPSLSREKEGVVKAQAAEQGAEAWEARVQVDERRLRLTRSIGWRRLR